MIRQAVILCGGLGTRLGELTARTPKPLLPVAGAPFLDVLVEEAVRQGFNDILLLAGHLAEEIQSYARSSAAARRFGASVSVAIEPSPAGMAGALRYARDRLHDEFIRHSPDGLMFQGKSAPTDGSLQARSAGTPSVWGCGLANATPSVEKCRVSCHRDTPLPSF